MITDEMVEAAAKAWCDYYNDLPEDASYLQRKSETRDYPDRVSVRIDARSALLAALAAAPVAEEVGRVAKRLDEAHAHVTKHERPDMMPDSIDTVTIWTEAASLLRRLSAERDEAWAKGREFADVAMRNGEALLKAEAERDKAIRQRDQAKEALMKIAAADVLQFKINPVGGQDIVVEGKKWFVFADTVKTFRDIARSASAVLQGGEHDR